jgi:phosphate starvation-inducible PhoH-like protein
MNMAKRSRTSRNSRRDEIEVLDHKVENLFLDEKAVEIRRRGRNAKPRYQRNFQARTPVQADYRAACETSIVAFGVGPAGTGKSHVAVDTACEMFERGDVDMIVLSRPAVEAGGERLGFLPGGMREKLDPYMRPLYDILAKRLGRGEVDKLVTSGQIELCPLAFMRGRTFENAVVVLDEMQNATAKQLKLALTRLGDNCKCFVTGDPEQTDDLPNGAVSGLVPVAEALRDAPGIDVVYFGASDVVRSQIVGTVLSRI